MEDSDVAELERLRKENERLTKEKQSAEADFGMKRAKFIELFKQKEDALNEAQQLNTSLKEEMAKIKIEVMDVNTAAALSEGSKQDELEDLQRACRQEVASIQSIMKDALDQAAAKYEHDRAHWAELNSALEEELKDLKAKINNDRDGFLSSVAKTLQKKVVNSPLAGLQGSAEQENLEESMKKAQEDAEILKSVVMPLEEEVRSLKHKLRAAYGQLDELQGTKSVDSSDDSPDGIKVEYKEKMRELNDSLKTEKSSRTDLEMYVAVLNTQKTVLQDDTDKLRMELQEVCNLLDEERREHSDLKATWQMANDQFLESQRLMMMDLHAMEEVLTDEQQRKITELKKKNADREAAETRLKELEELRAQEEYDQKTRAHQAQAKRDAAEKRIDALIKIDETFSASLDDASDSLPRSQSINSFSSLQGQRELPEHAETRSLHDDCALRASPDRALCIPNLTEAQHKAIADPTPESEASQHLYSTAKARTTSDLNSMPGRRVVSEKEWMALQLELRSSREKLGKRCDMCRNYEKQLQEVQENAKKVHSQLRTLERQLEVERMGMAKQQEYSQTLEENLNQTTQEAEKEINTLACKLKEADKFVSALKQQFIQAQTELQDQLKILTENREIVHKELTKLQEENNSLVGKHSKHSQQMQEESIDLPNNLEELQLLVLRIREDIITAKVAKEHTEDTLKSEIMFLKDQVLAEQQEKTTTEEALSQEISQLQEELATLQSIKSEAERQSCLRSETEGKLKEAEASIRNMQAKSKQLIGAMQNQLEEQTNARAKLESDNQKLRMKVSSLQVDLENSEVVQRDFVKLSQSLQIQLEKIRAAEDEVRWQHEEDIDDCTNCKQSFSVTKRKHHCKHCGRIYCSDCITKSVNSGPNLRPSKVCDVCHTVLVKDATPYFSTAPPQTPD